MDALQSFINQLVSKPPGAPDSIQLEVDTEGDLVALFEVLLTIMTGILKSWYPPPISISKLTPADLERLVAYFASFGIRFQLAQEPIPPVFRLNNKAYETKRRLEDMTFQMTNDSLVYTVRFSHL